MVEDNLKARDMGIGVNGVFVIFYERTGDTAKPAAPPKPKADYTDLMNSLQSLGLSGLTTAIVEKAVSECYPKGTTSQDEQDILRTVFRHLKRSGTV